MNSMKKKATEAPVLRWGFVGTGGIANAMADIVATVPLAELRAVSSRRTMSANEFAERYDVALRFDDWRAMLDSDDIDAVYVATPTSVREEISIAAADAGKHVLAEKPFASAASVKRIIEACRKNDVAFMDGTHFVHHPRHHSIKNGMAELVGNPWSVASAFQFDLQNRGDIRYNMELEPMGAIGDAGWYNMRAALEYLSKDAAPVFVEAVLRRDEEKGAVVSGSGVIQFTDGSTTTWNCGFDSGALVMDLCITGLDGVINIDNFLGQDEDGSATYLYKQGSWGPDVVREVRRVDSVLPGAALMFENFALIAANAELREDFAWATLHTQKLLDACWESATRA
jgi:predicted dehydrogenase